MELPEAALTGLIIEADMDRELKNCWEITDCGRQAGGEKVTELGECITSQMKMGHSCWIVAGTLCRGEIQGTAAKKEQNCMYCEIFKRYNRLQGQYGELIAVEFPEEEERYKQILRQHINNHPS